MYRGWGAGPRIRGLGYASTEVPLNAFMQARFDTTECLSNVQTPANPRPGIKLNFYSGWHCIRHQGGGYLISYRVWLRGHGNILAVSKMQSTRWLQTVWHFISGLAWRSPLRSLLHTSGSLAVMSSNNSLMPTRVSRTSLQAHCPRGIIQSLGIGKDI
jgi:hypothetical protein